MINTTALARLTSAIAQSKGVKFVGLTYRSKESGELARHTMILGADYGNVLRDSLAALVTMPHAVADADETARLSGIVKSFATGTKERKAANAALSAFQDGIGAERAAVGELIVSVRNSIDAHANGETNEAYTKAGVYETICEGLKVSRVDGSFEICGLSHAKKVIEAGTFKTVKSSDKTLAKERIRKTLPLGKYRTYSLDAGALESVRIGGNVIDCE